jgi:Cupin superfamily protein
MNNLPPSQAESSAMGVYCGNALEQLFPRASERGALLEHWARGQFLFEPGDPKDLEERVAERFPTPEALAESAPDIAVSVYGFFDAARVEGSAAATDSVQDLYTFAPRTISDAVPLYHAGHTVICWRILDHLPEALQRATDILESVGLPHLPIAARGLSEPWSSGRPFVVSLVYTPASCASGLGMHFDRFDSIVVQLRGEKHWRVGRHPHLEYPIYNEDSAARLDFPPSLPRLATRSELVEELEDIEMRRGSVLLLPRGIYHTTLADDRASLSIGYHFALPTWSHTVLAALERRLTRDPLMRTTPFGAFSLAGPSAEAYERMAWAAERAREVLNDPRRLLEEDLLGNLASHHQAAFRLAPNAPARLVLDPPAIANYGGRGLDVELPAEADLFCRWMLSKVPAWFNFNDALAGSGGRMSPRAVWNLLQEAVEADLLERRWGKAGGRDTSSER